MEAGYSSLTIYQPLTVSKAPRETTQAAVSKSKNRRYRNAKISEYKLRQVVEAFAHDLTAKDAAERTRLSVTSVESIFAGLRERLFAHGYIKVQHKPGEEGGAVAAALGAKYRGLARHLWPHYEAEMLHRRIAFLLIGQPQRLKASNPKEIAKALRLYQNQSRTDRPRYNLVELLKPDTPDEAKPEHQRPFEPSDYRRTSVILVNERMLSPAENFFHYLWRDLLLAHPL